MQTAKIVTISELTKMIKHQLEQPMFRNIAVAGEISNFIHHSSGHMYFTLKDDKSKIKAVMFRSRNINLNASVGNGDTVVVIGSIGIYEPNGEYQIYVDQLFPQGVGALHIQFEKLKQKLQAEGLFEQERKRKLPFLPTKVGVITSPTGAAIRDVLSVIKRRYPGMDVLIIPATVQGADGPDSVVRAFQAVAEQPDIDVVIVGRGGGSIEELWTFNDEKVARAIANCSVPVVSGVGHETDFTIADFVADHRAPTPSAAAELVVPDYFELKRHLLLNYQRLVGNMEKSLDNKKTNLSYLTNRGALIRPEVRINRERQQVDELLSRVHLIMSHSQERLTQRLAAVTGKLDSLSPLATLSRGYAICSKNNGQVITDSAQVLVGDQVTVRLKQSQLFCKVEKREKLEEKL